MECDTVRQLTEDEPLDSSVIVHLASCPACRAEAEFGRQLAAAVASIPRVPAPAGMAASVLAAIQPATRPLRPARPRPSLLLRPWELGWLGAACLLLIALLKAAFGTWVSPVAVQLSPWLSGWTPPQANAAGALSALRTWALNQANSLGSSRDLLASWTGPSFAWICGAVAFAFGLFLLLSWHGGAGSKDTWEDAHA